jgi:hypothetical protein
VARALRSASRIAEHALLKGSSALFPLCFNSFVRHLTDQPPKPGPFPGSPVLTKMFHLSWSAVLVGIAVRLKFAAQVMRTNACLHADQAPRYVREPASIWRRDHFCRSTIAPR